MISLEPLDYGGQSLHWDAIEQCVRESVGNDDMTVANAMGALRRKDMIAWAVWRDGKVAAIMVTRPVENGYSGGKAMLIYGLRGDLEMDDWHDAATQFESACRAAGATKIVAYLRDDRAARLANALGWTEQRMAWKELGNG